MSSHSRLGPSSAERWTNCAGSVALSETVPKQPSSEFAAEGTVAHGLAEKLVTGKIDQLALASMIGQIVKEDGFEIEITDEMIEAAVEYNDLIDHDSAEFQTTSKGGVDVHHEAEIRVCAKSIDPDLWGTADYLLFQKGKKLVVYDFKYGKGVEVSPVENKQMGIYAIAAMDTITGSAYDEVELVIVQPRTTNPVRRWVTPAGWLKEFREELKAAVAATRVENAPLTAGNWCRWCPAKPMCPKLHETVQEQAMVEFSAEPHPTSPMPSAALLTAEQLARVLTWEEPIEGFLKSVRERAKDLLSSGAVVPGFKLVDGRSTRKYIDERKVVETFAPVLGQDKLYEPRKVLSPAKLEKLVGKGKLDDLTEKTWGVKSVAPESDPRPAVQFASAQDDFGAAQAAVPIDGAALTFDAQMAELMGEPVPSTTPQKMWPQ